MHAICNCQQSYRLLPFAAAALLLPGFSAAAAFTPLSLSPAAPDVPLAAAAAVPASRSGDLSLAMQCVSRISLV